MKSFYLLPLALLASAYAPPDYGSFDHIPEKTTHELPDVARLSFLHNNNEHMFRAPQVRLVVYVQTFMTPEHKPLSLLPLLDHETKVTHIILASMHLHDEPGVIKLNDDDFDSPKWDRLWGEVKILQKAGIKVMGLLGGAAKGTYSKLNGTEKEFYRYYHPLLDLVKKHGLDGLDVDIEEEVPVSVPLRILNAFFRDMGPGFLLTMSPLSSALVSEEDQNASGFSYFELDKLATVPGSDRKLVSWYNAMFYGGFAHGPPVYALAMEAGWEPSRVVMGVLCSPGDGQPNGFLHIEQLKERTRDLREEHAGFGGVAGWEYHDAGDVDGFEGQPWEWVKEVGRALFYVWPKKHVEKDLRSEYGKQPRSGWNPHGHHHTPN